MNRSLKHGVMLWFGLACLIDSAYGSDDAAWCMTMQAESTEKGSASSLRVSTDLHALGYIGISLNRITSSTPIQIGNRTSIYPVYFFGGLNAPWQVSPFVELGTDLVDQLFDHLDGSADDTEKDDEVDTYLAGGVRYAVSPRLGISLYAKRYFFKYRSVSTAPLSKSFQNGIGLGVSLRF